MISPAVHNLAIVKYMMISLVMNRVITNKGFRGVVADILCGVSLYVDPSLIYVLIPVRLISNLIDNKKSLIGLNVIKSFLIWASVMIALLSLVEWKADIRNYINILHVRDHSENIGIYWYIFVEIFKQHVFFYQNLYLLFLAILAIQVVLDLSLFTRVVTAFNPNNKDHSKRILCWSFMLTLYVRNNQLKYITLAAYDPVALSLADGRLPPTFSPYPGLPTPPALRGGPRGDNLRTALLGAEHAFHVDYVGRPVQRQCELFLLPNSHIRALPHHHVHSVIWCRR